MIIEKILNFTDEYDMLPEAGLVIACVSGGADSMCLLEALLDISRDRGFGVCAAHYNHGLRGEESDRDEGFVRDYCAARGVRFFSGCGDVRDYAAKHGMGIEEAARTLRYDFFTAKAEKAGAGRIATAHTADDNAETLLLNFTRGAGAAGLSGIPPVRGGGAASVANAECRILNAESAERQVRIIRPMLRVSRDEVMSFLSERGIPYVEDSSNSLDVYTRNKIRHYVIPVLKEINPRLVESAASAAELSRADEEYLSALACEFIGLYCDGIGGERSVDAGDLLRLPVAVSGRVIRKMYGGNLSYRHVKAVLDLCGRDSASASLSLPGMIIYREYGRIVFGGEVRAKAEGFVPITITPADAQWSIPGTDLNLSCKSVLCNDTINKSLTSFLFDYVQLCGKISVRPRLAGDTIKLSGTNCTKTLKKLFIERRIPARSRALIPVIADESGVLAVYGIGMGDRAVPVPGDMAFQVEFTKGMDGL